MREAADEAHAVLVVIRSTMLEDVVDAARVRLQVAAEAGAGAEPVRRSRARYMRGRRRCFQGGRLKLGGPHVASTPSVSPK